MTELSHSEWQLIWTLNEWAHRKSQAGDLMILAFYLSEIPELYHSNAGFQTWIQSVFLSCDSFDLL